MDSPQVVSVVPGKQSSYDDVDEEEMRRRQRLLLMRFMESFGPGRRCVSVKKAQASWSHRNHRRLAWNHRAPNYPIILRRVVEHDQVEQAVHRSGGPGEPDRPAVLTAFHQEAEYYLHELGRERSTVQKEGSSAPRKEVAVIRGMPGGHGITVVSHVDLVVRLLAP
jgi:hypothetical protein